MSKKHIIFWLILTISALLIAFAFELIQKQRIETRLINHSEITPGTVKGGDK
jgi:hypothetical protein